ncbi:unnamed protein product [Coffea canephora]|uniref:DUF3082 domain-containing protein n=2 Tax=Coffea TaxID=13442 RepID=A0A068UEA1_COFCA|nr:unnamed protein product [Coffea canephora]
MPTLTLKSPHAQIFQTPPHCYFPFPQSSSSLLTFSPLPISPSCLNFLCKSLTATISRSVSAHNHHTTTEPWLAQVPEQPNTTATVEEAPPEEGPIEIPSSSPSVFATSDKPTPIQTATSVLLTGAITVFLFRSIRRRAKRSKELKLRSSGAKKSLKEEALENLKVMVPTPIDAKSSPSPVQALLGGLTAGAIALLLYKFTTTIEAALNQQPLSDNFSVRQITITIRTIVNGLCYLATFVFSINSVGLLLYSGQLVINSFMGDSQPNESKNGGEAQVKSSDESPKGPIDSSGIRSLNEDPSSDSSQ